MVELTCMRELTQKIKDLLQNLFRKKDNSLSKIGYLELEDAPGFISEAPKNTLEQNILLSEQLLPNFNKNRQAHLDDYPKEEFYL